MTSLTNTETDARHISPRRGAIALAVALLLAAAPTFSQEEQASGQEQVSAPAATDQPAEPEAATTADPDIPSGQLELLLQPLTRDELLLEAEAWRDLVKQKVSETSALEIETRRTTASGAQQAPAQGQRAETLERLNALREEKSALLDRLETVLDAYEEKGGDPTELRQYARAVAGLSVEVSDTSATMAAITGWLSSREGGVKWGIRILQFVGIMVVFWILAGIFGGLVRRATSSSEHMSGLLKGFFNKFVRRLVLFIGVLVALSTLGVEVGALLALVGGGAFILGFALQDSLGNFAAGLMLLIYRPFDVGDTVEVGGVSGKVDNVSLVSTTIRTFDNKIVLVPNKQVWGQVITNATASDQRRVDMTFGIGYDDDVEKAREILQRVVAEHELVLDDPAPVIELHNLGDSSVDFICRPWTRTDDYWRVYWDVTHRVKKDLTDAGISIPYPQRDIHVYQTGEPT